MTASSRTRGKVVGRPSGRKHVETRRRTRRLAPGVVGLCLVMILASLTLVVSPAMASRIGSPSGSSIEPFPSGPGGPSTTTTSVGGPLLISPGTWVTFTCTHGTISLDGTQYCSHTTTASVFVCDTSPSCPFTMVGTVDSGYTFYGWLLSGQASVSCEYHCLTTTLTVYTPSPSNHYTASVTLDTTSPPPPPTVPVTVTTFENWSVRPPWLPAEVQACLSGTCVTLSNGQTLPLDQGYSYTIKAVNLQLDTTFLEWSSDAGSLTNARSNPTTFTPSQPGILTLITNWTSSGAGYVYSPPASSLQPLPSVQNPSSNCFGGGTCIGPSGTSNGSGWTCVISGFSESAGDFLYVAINYLYNMNIVSSVSDGGGDTFTFVGGEFASQQSVAFYDVTSEHGGTVTITVTLSAIEFGTCRAGQLSPGTMVGVVGTGGNANAIAGTSLTVTNTATNEPSLLMALFGSTRPSGGWTDSSPPGSWVMGGLQLTGYNPGANSELIAFNDTSSGTVNFTMQLGNSGYDIYLSGIVVEFYLGVPRGGISSISTIFTLPGSTGVSFSVWVGFGGIMTIPGQDTPLWQAGVSFSPTTGIAAFFESIPGPTVYYHSLNIQPDDQMEVTITSSGGTSSFSVQDLSRLGQPTVSGSNSSFVPNLLSGEWIDEPNATGSSSEVNFTYMSVNGVGLTLSNSLIGYTFEPLRGSPWYVTPLVAGSTSTVFSVLPP